MKTKIQDLDDKTFKELIHDKLSEGKVYDKPGFNNFLNRQDFTVQEESSFIDSPPTLVKESSGFNSNVDVSPTSNFESIQEKCHKSVSQDEIKRSCKCKQFKTGAKNECILKRHDIQQRKVDKLYSKTNLKGLSETDICSVNKEQTYDKNLKNAFIYDPLDSKLYRCELCNKSLITYDLLIHHRKTHQQYSGKLPYECEECGQTFLSEHYLQAHCRSHHGDVVGLECYICGASFRFETNLAYHLKNHNENNIYKCDECEEQFLEKFSLTEHMKTHVQLKCHECDTRFSTENNLRVHVRTHKNKGIFYKCVICKQEFSSENAWEEHVLTHVGIYPYKCGRCGAGFNYESHLKEHVLIHVGKSAHTYNLCSKSFATDIALEKHVPSQSSETINKCPICNDVFNEEKLLAKHLQLHIESKHSCEMCGKSFATATSLVKHEIQHTYVEESKCNSSNKSTDDDVKSGMDKAVIYDCDLCYERFSSLRKLRKHFLTHGGTDQSTIMKIKQSCYECILCHKMFRKLTTLQMHIPTHRTVSNIVCRCQLCGKGFARLKSLDKHIMNTHSTDHQCDICDKKFEYETELEDHIRIHFEKDTNLAFEVNKRRQKMSPIITEDNQWENVPSGSFTKGNSHDLADDSGNKNVLLIEIKSEPEESNNVHNDSENSTYYTKTTDPKNVNSPQHVQTESKIDVQQQSIEICSEIDSVYSPQSVYFSPRGKVIGSDTDSGYSDKIHLLTSDTESVYSPRIYFDKGIAFQKHNDTKINTQSMTEEMKYEQKFITVDKNTERMLDNNLPLGLESENKINTFFLHENFPSIKEEDNLTIQTDLSLSSLLDLQNHSSQTSYVGDTISSRKRTYKKLSNSDYNDQPLSSHQKSRVPFFFNMKGKKLNARLTNQVNFHLLGKLK